MSKNKQATNYSIKMVDKITLYTFKKQGFIKISGLSEIKRTKKAKRPEAVPLSKRKYSDDYLSVSFKP